MLDKIIKIIKKEDSSIQAPKELPNLLYEDEENSDEISQAPIENTDSNNIEQSEVQTQDAELDESLHLSEQKNQSKTQEETQEQEISQPRFVDEKVGELNQEVSSQVIQRSQGELTPQIIPLAQESKKAEIQNVDLTPQIIPSVQESKKAEIQNVEPKPIQEEIKEAKEESKQELNKEPSEEPNKNIEEVKKRIFTKSENNFFKTVEDAISNASDISKIQELMHQDLFKSMKIHHKTEEEHNNLNLKLDGIETEVSEKLMHLKVLEDEWMIEKKKLELQEKIFLEKEEEVFQGIEELKSLFSKLDMNKKLNQQISEDNHFILENGQKIENFASLITNLKMMGDEVFNHHVNEERNDFARWIKHVYGLNELAKEIQETESRPELISFLEQL